MNGATRPNRVISYGDLKLWIKIFRVIVCPVRPKITENVIRQPAQAIQSTELNDTDETSPPAMETYRELGHTYSWVVHNLKYAKGEHVDRWIQLRNYI